MTKTSRFPVLASCLVLTLPLAGQDAIPAAADPQAEATSTRLTPEGFLAPADLVVPIHVARGNNHSEREGLWAGGPGFAVSFADTVSFFPSRTAESQPGNWQWRTHSIRIGGASLFAAGDSPRPRWTERRFELDRGPVVEAYDVRVDGIEQTFTIARRPPVQGDLIVRGSISFAGDAEGPDSWRHGGIAFRDSTGKEMVRYGAAWAIDANGDKVEMSTRYRDGGIELRIGAAWLQSATFPVVLDPLISNPVVRSTTQIRVLGQARDDVANQLMILGRVGANTVWADWQDFIYLCNDDYSAPRLIGWTFNGTTELRDVVFVGGARRWLVLSRNRYGSTPRVRVYFHDSGSNLYRSGVDRSSYPSRPVNSIGIGGSLAFKNGNNGIIVYTARSRGRAVLVDARNRTLGSPIDLGAAYSIATNPVSGGNGDPWLVGIGYQDSGGNLYPPRVIKVSPTGQVSASHRVPVNLTNHSLSPVYSAGMNGNYVIHYAGENSNRSTWRRMDWYGSGTPVFRSEHSPVGSRVRDIAFDTTTKSHWCIARGRFFGSVYFLVLDRIGATANTVELAYLRADHPGRGGSAGHVTYNDDRRTFAASYAGRDGDWRGAVLAHDPRARKSYYGTGCGGSISSPDQPYAGFDNFRVQLRAAEPNASAYLLISLRPASVPLAGCTVLADLNSPYVIGMRRLRTSSVGTAEYRQVFFDRPMFLGSMYFQWMYSTPRGLRFTRGMRADVYP